MAEPLAYSIGTWTTKSGQSDAFVKIWKDTVNYVAQNNKCPQQNNLCNKKLCLN